MLRLLVLLLAFTSCARGGEVRVFAAASLSDALTEIGARYERERGERVVFNFGGSNVLARQIRLGAPADLFLSADERTMDSLDVTDSVSVLSNTLVIVGGEIHSPRDLAGKRLALGEPATVPAGIYAREYLTAIGVWSTVARHVVPTDNVRGALAAVRSGNVDAAIVYRTDVKGPVAYEVPRSATPRISYPFAVLRHAENREGARRFLAYLRSKPALDVFARHGFLIQ